MAHDHEAQVDAVAQQHGWTKTSVHGWAWIYERGSQQLKVRYRRNGRLAFTSNGNTPKHIFTGSDKLTWVLQQLTSPEHQEH